jgi:hypothetical protein
MVPVDRFVVWRQDEGGNRYEVSRHATREEADRVAAGMEARGHKQTYWVAVVAAPQGPPPP